MISCFLISTYATLSPCDSNWVVLEFLSVDSSLLSLSTIVCVPYSDPNVQSVEVTYDEENFKVALFSDSACVPNTGGSICTPYACTPYTFGSISIDFSIQSSANVPSYYYGSTFYQSTDTNCLNPVFTVSVPGTVPCVSEACTSAVDPAYSAYNFGYRVGTSVSLSPTLLCQVLQKPQLVPRHSLLPVHLQLLRHLQTLQQLTYLRHLQHLRRLQHLRHLRPLQRLQPQHL
jgi:hypothetical protein